MNESAILVDAVGHVRRELIDRDPHVFKVAVPNRVVSYEPKPGDRLVRREAEFLRLGRIWDNHLVYAMAPLRLWTLEFLFSPEEDGNCVEYGIDDAMRKIEFASPFVVVYSVVTWLADQRVYRWQIAGVARVDEAR
jgi:hypothetical protein